MIVGSLSEVLYQAPFDRTFLLAGLEGNLIVVADGDAEDWERVRSLVEDGKKMISLEIRFRSASFHVAPDRAGGYFFRPAVAACLSGSSHSFNLFVVGHLDEAGQVHTQSVVVPELVVVNRDIRQQSDQESVGSSLILNW